MELDGIEDRIVRLTPNSSNLASAILSKDGEKLYYLSAFAGQYDLRKMELRTRNTRLLHKMNTGWADMEMDEKGNIFILSGSSIQKMAAAGEALKPVNYRASVKMDQAAERAYMFDHVCRQEDRYFYNKGMHGVNWKQMTADYRKFLPHINNNYDYAELLSELLGDLFVFFLGGCFCVFFCFFFLANLR